MTKERRGSGNRVGSIGSPGSAVSSVLEYVSEGKEMYVFVLVNV
jgi:hypothetical protein